MRDRASVSSVLKISVYAVAVAIRVAISSMGIGSSVEDMAVEVMRVRRVKSPRAVRRAFEGRIC